MKQFLTYGHILTAEEIESHPENGVPETPPTLEQFKQQVCFFKSTIFKPFKYNSGTFG